MMHRVRLLTDGDRRARTEFGNGFAQLMRRQNLAHGWQAHDQPHGEQGKPCGQAFACGGGRVHPRMVTQSDAVAWMMT